MLEIRGSSLLLLTLACMFTFLIISSYLGCLIIFVSHMIYQDWNGQVKSYMHLLWDSSCSV